MFVYQRVCASEDSSMTTYSVLYAVLTVVLSNRIGNKNSQSSRSAGPWMIDVFARQTHMGHCVNGDMLCVESFQVAAQLDSGMIQPSSVGDVFGSEVRWGNGWSSGRIWCVYICIYIYICIRIWLYIWLRIYSWIYTNKMRFIETSVYSQRNTPPKYRTPNIGVWKMSVLFNMLARMWVPCDIFRVYTTYKVGPPR